MRNKKTQKTISIFIILILVILAVYFYSKMAPKALAPDPVISDAEVADEIAVPKYTIAFLKDLISKSEMIFSIYECQSKGDMYLSVQPEATGDVPNSVYSFNGENLGYCGGFAPQEGRGAQPEICRSIVSCRVIYQPASQFTNQAEIDSYNLSEITPANSGNVEDLVSFSVKPGDSVSG